MAKVLIVDDSLLEQRLAGACVESTGATVVYAANGREALAMIAAEQPDAVLTDLLMPVMDGLELVREMRKLHPNTPVILMTAYGSEEIAAQALRSGAASYVPKKNLKQDLMHPLKRVLQAAASAQHEDTVRNFLQHTESYFVLGYENGGSSALVSHLLAGLKLMHVCDEGDIVRVGTALHEALANAIEHGNLEMDSKLRDEPDGTYRSVFHARAEQREFRDRRVHVIARMSKDEVAYVVRDEGPGFDPTGLPDPTDPENLLKTSGRGILLIHTFMDQVSFNEQGNEITMIKRRNGITND